MDLKEIKKIASYARRNGIKTLKVNGFEVEFHENAAEVKTRKPRLKAAPDDKAPVPAADPGPTLDQINEFIYGNTEEIQ